MKSAIFDMDGTILDTLEDLYLSVNAALDEFGLPDRSFSEVRQLVGNGMLNLITRSVPEGTPDELRDRVLEFFLAHYAKHCNDHTRPYEGVPEMLGNLKRAGIGLAVVSNKGDFAVQDLAELHFPGVFDVVLGQREGIERKPAPDMVYKAMEDLGCDAHGCVYVGDSEVDVTTCDNAGVRLLAVTWGFRSDEQLIAAGAKRMYGTPSELERAIGSYLSLG